MTPATKSVRSRRDATVLRNFVSLAGGRLLGDLSTLVLLAVLSHCYGRDGLGDYSLAMAIAGFLAVASNFGLTQMGMKDLSRPGIRFGEQFGQLLGSRLVLVAIASAALAVLVPAMQWLDQLGIAVALLGVSQILFSIGLGFTASMIAREDMHLAAVLELALRLTTLVGAGTAALLKLPLWLVFTVFPLTNLLFSIAAATLAIRRYGRPVLPARAGSWATLRNAVPYGLSELLSQVTNRVDILTVGLLLGSAAAGIYNAGFRVLFSLNFVAALAARSILPLLSRLHSDPGSDTGRLFSRALATALLIAVPASVGLWLVADPAIALIFGHDFAGSARILRWLAPLLALNCTIYYITTYLMATDRQAVATRLQWWTAALNIVGNLVLVPLVGAIGAAVSTLVAQGALAGLMVGRLTGEIDLGQIGSRLTIALAGSAAMVILSAMTSMYFAFFVPLAVALYVLTIGVFPAIRNTEFAAAWTLARQWRAHGELAGPDDKPYRSAHNGHSEVRRGN